MNLEISEAITNPKVSSNTYARFKIYLKKTLKETGILGIQNKEFNTSNRIKKTQENIKKVLGIHKKIDYLDYNDPGIRGEMPIGKEIKSIHQDYDETPLGI